jgi:hypothetical protein
LCLEGKLTFKHLKKKAYLVNFFLHEKTITGKPMNIASQIEEKKPRKYSLTNRVTQAKLLDESKGQSQRELAKKHSIPRTTIQHWQDRKNKLTQETQNRERAIFFESVTGCGWLHELITATIMTFNQNGTAGMPEISEFCEIIGINKHVGTSISALQKVRKTLDKQVDVFGKEESKNLAQNMPHRNICGALDENFIMRDMTLVLMCPVSGYVLSEELAEKRDGKTWNEVTKAATGELNVTMHQMVGDEAPGLIKVAETYLNIIKGSDLFHIQQEITRGLTGPLARTVEQVKKNKKC